LKDSSAVLLWAGAQLLWACAWTLPATAAWPAARPPGWVDSARLQQADQEPGQWLGIGRDGGETHYSPLTRIDSSNVRSLGLAWVYDGIRVRGTVNRGLEATPIVVDGVMYVSGPWSVVYALDAKTGRPLWVYDPEVDGAWARKACCDVVNRGVAVWKGKVYVGTLDGYLIALDAGTGQVLWKTDTLIDRTRAYVINGAPRIAGDDVVIGNAGADMGVRGYVSAYDLDSGALGWRFFTVPGDPAKGFEHAELAAAAKTWDPHSRWEYGGGGTAWDSMVYDPQLDLLYVGTGNAGPHPRWTRSPSGGDNLYLASILAIQAKTGRLAWHYQTTPGESWDYTATQNMILADLKFGDEVRPVLMQAPKNGFFYVIDRRDGTLLSADPFATVTWADRVDKVSGRPVISQQGNYEKAPKLVFPANWGAHNWQPMSYSPNTGLVYIPVLDGGVVFEREKAPRYRLDSYNAAADERLPEAGDTKLLRGQPVPQMRSVLVAWDPMRSRAVWRVPQKRFYNGGILSTGSNLVFQGDASGAMTAYDGHSGTELSTIRTGTGIMAAPMSYEIDGEQYIAVAAGFGGAVLGGDIPGAAALEYQNLGRILVFKLGGGPVPLPPKQRTAEVFALPDAGRSPASEMRRGQTLFRANCGTCHGERGGGGYPNLWNLPPVIHEQFEKIVLGGLLAHDGMASFANVMSTNDVAAVHAFLIEDARAQRSGGGPPTAKPSARQH
jgi:quinohemoprotein ethanol dehydrogenase